MRKSLLIAGLAAMCSGSFLGIGSTAEAATARNGVCETGEFCLYFNSDHQGSVSDFTTSVPDYGADQPSCYEYKGPGNGKGDCVKNDAASAWNRTGKPVTLYFNSGYGGARQTFAPGDKVNLNAQLKNENAAHRIGDDGSRPERRDMSDALYQGGGGRLTAGFDGYRNTPGRHEGIDFAKGSGSNVKALISGKVIYVNEGGGGLSTISIYNAGFDKTMIYLHTNPRNGLFVGKNISRGDVIADEAARGAGATHTHVELRNGRRQLAAKSVGDPTLDNPNPSSFWRARGYRVR